MSEPHDNAPAPAKISTALVRSALSTGRIASLADCVFAFAMTLLAMNLRMPHHDGVDADHLTQALWSQWPNFFGYVISFLVIGVYWTGHNGIIKTVVFADRTFLWINIVFILCITFIPFPTALVGEYGRARSAVVLYTSTLAITGLALYWSWWHACRKRLIDPSITPQMIRVISTRILWGPGIYVIALAISCFNLTLSLLICVAVPLLYIFSRRIDAVLEHRRHEIQRIGE